MPRPAGFTGSSWPPGCTPGRWGGERELTHAIYGTVVGAAAMAAASLHGTLPEMIITVLVTVAVYWTAERYAEILAAAIHEPGHRLRRVGQALRRGWPTVEAAYTPLIVLIAVTLITGEPDIGVLAALTVSTTMLSGLGYLTARRAGATRPPALAFSHRQRRPRHHRHLAEDLTALIDAQLAPSEQDTDQRPCY